MGRDELPAGLRLSGRGGLMGEFMSVEGAGIRQSPTASVPSGGPARNAAETSSRSREGQTSS